MAKATKVIHRIEPNEKDVRQAELQDIEDALIENKETILETLELMKQVQSTELPNILKALIAEREAVLEHIVTFLDGADLTRSLSNAMQLFTVLGQFNFEEMEPVVEKLNAGLNEVANAGHKRGGYATLLQSMTDPGVIEGLNTALAFTKGLGSSGIGETKTYDLPDKQNNDEKTNNTRNTKWIVVAAVSASVLSLPFLFRNK